MPLSLRRGVRVRSNKIFCKILLPNYLIHITLLFSHLKKNKMNKIKNNIKQTAILFLALLFATTAFAKTRTAKAIIKTHFNCDHCKKCETCGKKFEAELYNTKGIKDFSIDEKTMTITVIYNPNRVDLQTIKTAISKLGFDADEVKADPIAYEKLDGCCKK